MGNNAAVLNICLFFILYKVKSRRRGGSAVSAQTHFMAIYFSEQEGDVTGAVARSILKQWYGYTATLVLSTQFSYHWHHRGHCDDQCYTVFTMIWLTPKKTVCAICSARYG